MFEFLKSWFGGSSDPKAPEHLSDLAARFPFPTRVVPGKAALAERERMQTEGPGTSVVILGDDSDFQPLLDSLAAPLDPPQEILAKAEALNLENWFDEQKLEAGEFFIPVPAPWPETEPPPIQIGLHLKALSGRPKPHVVLGAVPVMESWQIPSVFGYGGWNDYPIPEVHAALHRRWSESYGCAIVSISGDIIECVVSRRPASREEALRLAHEQFVYCPDIVHQGTRSIEGLAAVLMVSDAWYFWWD